MNYKLLQIFFEETKQPLIVYHGTSLDAAKDILQNGINMDRSHLGYFGKGFYTTPNESLAKSNYADFADEDDGPGIVLAFKVSPNARLLDLRNPNDWEKYKKLKLHDHIHKSNFDQIAVQNGVDGLYDNSFEGWVFYNPKILQPVTSIEELQENETIQDYLYHVTRSGLLESISEEGLQPNRGRSVGTAQYDQHRKNRIFATTENGTETWILKLMDFAHSNSDEFLDEGWIPVILRFQRLDDDQPDTIARNERLDSEAVFIEGSIEPQDLEIWTGTEWESIRPLSEEELSSALDDEGFFKNDSRLFNPFNKNF